MTDLIRASTTSMTSVPKPLKFMIPHYETMKEVHLLLTLLLLLLLGGSSSPSSSSSGAPPHPPPPPQVFAKMAAGSKVKRQCADVVSVLAMTMSEVNKVNKL